MAFSVRQRVVRDVAVSCWLTGFDRLRWANEPNHIASQIRDYQRLMQHWRKVLPVPILEVSYETVVADLVRQRSQTVYYILTRMKSAAKVWLNRQRSLSAGASA